VFALTAHRNVDKLYAQCLQFLPQYAVINQAEVMALGMIRNAIKPNQQAINIKNPTIAPTTGNYRKRIPTAFMFK